MNSRTLKTLGAVVIGLVLIWLLLDLGGNESRTSSELLPTLKAQINDVDSLAVRQGESITTIERRDESWTVKERSGYPADVGSVREVMIALSDAKILERKTSNSEKYGVLGVADIGNDGDGSELIVSVGDEKLAVIIGNTAQSEYRYARIAGEEQSLLIDQNPTIPDSTGGWLRTDVIDVAANRISSVVINHADGEVLELRKASADNSAFDVSNVPAGRELTYPTVANSVGDALAGLSLEDVRPADDALEAITTAVFTTFDGLVINASEYAIDGASWFHFSAASEPTVTKELAAQDTVANDDTSEQEDIADDDGGEGEAAVDPVAEAEAINARVSNWLYSVPESSAGSLRQRMADLLAPEETAAD